MHNIYYSSTINSFIILHIHVHKNGILLLGHSLGGTFNPDMSYVIIICQLLFFHTDDNENQLLVMICCIKRLGSILQSHVGNAEALPHPVRAVPGDLACSCQSWSY